MSRSILLSFIVYVCLILGLAFLRGELVAFSIPFALYLLFGFLRLPEMAGLEVERRLSAERALPGQDVTVSLRLINHGTSVDEALVEDALPEGLSLLEGSNRYLGTLGRGETVHLNYTVSGGRGDYIFPGARVEARDGFGLFQRVEEFAPRGQLLILPPVLRLKHVPIRPRRTRVYAGTIPAHVGGSGVDFFGVRGYQPSDPPRHINWHVSARQVQDLYSNEFEQERVADVGILLDGRDRTNLFGGGFSIFDHSVLAASALAEAFLAQGNRVGLLFYGKYLQWTLPAYGKLQREKILSALAAARTGGSDIFASLTHLPTWLFPSNSQIVVVSPLNSEDFETLVHLRARGYQVMAVSPDPVLFESAHLRQTREVQEATRILRLERELLFRRLRRAGIQTLDWDVSQPFDQAVRFSLSRPPQALRAVGSMLK